MASLLHLDTASLHSGALGDGTDHLRLYFGWDGTCFYEMGHSTFALVVGSPSERTKPLGCVGWVLKPGKIDGFLTF